MNNKGFMMAEVIVVSAIVMLTIVGLYQSYNKIYSIYNTRIDYYDSTTLYRLGYYRDILIENNKLYTIITDYKGKVQEIYSANNKNNFSLPEAEISPYDTDTVFLVPTQCKINNNKYECKISGKELSNEEINQTFKDYLSYLSTSTIFASNQLLVLERCTTREDNKKNIDDCKYAYIEIFDGSEGIDE